MADTAQQEAIQCSRCHKRFYADGFKVDRLGRRLKTCLECNGTKKSSGLSQIIECMDIHASHISRTSQWIHSQTRKEGVRGAWCYCANSISDLFHNITPPIIYLPSEEVELLECESASTDYNPETHFILIIAVTISKTRAKQGRHDSITKAYTVHKDTGNPTFTSRRIAAGQDTAQFLKKHVCVVCREVAEKKCERCRFVSYCSRDCQVKDWPTHKQSCKDLKDNKASLLEMLDDSATTRANIAPAPRQSPQGLTDDDLTELLGFAL